MVFVCSWNTFTCIQIQRILLHGFFIKNIIANNVTVSKIVPIELLRAYSEKRGFVGRDAMKGKIKGKHTRRKKRIGIIDNLREGNSPYTY